MKLYKSHTYCKSRLRKRASPCRLNNFLRLSCESQAVLESNMALQNSFGCSSTKLIGTWPRFPIKRW